MPNTLLPRGIRNNNPGNLKYTATDKWQGLANPPSDGTFFVFQDPVYGIRAMARTLIAYQDKDGCHTLGDVKKADGTIQKGFISRYSDTDVASYISSVAAYMQITPSAIIDVHHYSTLRPMIEAQIQVENGGSWDKYYSSDQLDKALTLAGVEDEKKPLATSPAIVAGTVAAVATVAPTVLDQINQMHSLLLPYASSMPVVHTVCTVLALAAVGYSLWVKYSERQRGVS